MNDEKNSPDLVSDAPTIVGKQAQHIRDEVSKSKTDAADIHSAEDEDSSITEDISDHAADEENTDDIAGYYSQNDDTDDFDDFSEAEPESGQTDNPPDSNTSDSLTSSSVKEDPSMDRAINMVMKKNPGFLSHLRKTGKILLIILCILLALLIVLFAVCTVTRPSDTVSKNVWIGDLYVGGLSYDDTLASVEASDLTSEQTIKLKCNDNYYTLSGADIGSVANAEETAKKAFDYGKSGNFLKDGFTQIRLLASKHVMNPSSDINTDLLSEVLRRFGTDMYGELVQHSVEFTDTEAVVTPGHTGFDGDVSAALEEVKNAVAAAHYNPITVTLKSAPPDDFTIETFDNVCYKDPVDAYYNIQGNSVDIVPEQNGRYINKEEAAAIIPSIKEGGEKVTVPIYLSYAAITKEELKSKLFANTLGSYSTYYGSSASNRAANVARAAGLINGTVIAPGAVFSFNDTVGPRSKANGFYTAQEYVDGKTVEGIGGGTCQVSTTLYSAVLYADMTITARENHMMTIGYAPLGQDATVAYGSVDFKFKNSSDYPVKISAVTNGSAITVSIIGTAWEPAREVKLSHSTAMSGKNTVVTSVRRVYSNGELISTDKLGTSVYRPHEPEENN